VDPKGVAMELTVIIRITDDGKVHEGKAEMDVPAEICGESIVNLSKAAAAEMAQVARNRHLDARNLAAREASGR